MTARVNLLPQTSRERARESTARLIMAGCLLLLIVALGGLYWWKAAQVTDAEDRLAQAQETTTLLRAEQAELQEFADLERRLEESSVLLTAAMASEISVAGFLQDLALVVPTDTQFETLDLSLEPLERVAEDEPADASASPADGEEPIPPPPVATFTVTGKTLTSHAPGVERLLLQLDKAANFDDVFLNTSLLEDREEQPELDDQVASYSLEGGVTQSALTRRYSEGLPEVLR